MEKFLKSKLYLLITVCLFCAFWFLCWLCQVEKISPSYLLTFESLELTIIGVIASTILIRYKNMYYVLPWIIYLPFVFTHPFDTTTIPYAMFVSIGLIVIGVVVHMIRFKVKIRLGSFFAGLAAISLALILGGINTGAEYVKQQVIFCSLAGVSLLALYMCFASGVDIDFRNLCHIISFLGMYLVFQVLGSFYFLEDRFSFLINKNIEVGWGISNNIAIILLFTFPCSIYLAIKSKYAKTFLYTFIAYGQIIALIVTYSRGAIFALGVGGAIFLVYSIFAAIRGGAKTLISYVASITILLAITGVGIYHFLTTTNETIIPYAEGFKDNLTKINLDTFNGRDPIYAHYMDEFKSNIIFGKGLYSPYYDNEFTGGYQWGHSTVVHTLYTMGLVGGISLVLHMVQKYLNLLIRPNIEKMIALFCFLISGIYGLIDVSYYFINYMVVLIFFLAGMERTIEESFDII